MDSDKVEDLIKNLSSGDLEEVINKIGSSPERYSKLMEEEISKNPEMKETMNKISQNNQFVEKLRKQATKNGINNKKNLKKLRQSFRNNSNTNKRKVICITQTRKAKELFLNKDDLVQEAQKVIKTICFYRPCYRIQVGPFSNNDIQIIFPHQSVLKNNRRATRLIGEKVRGDLIIYDMEKDLNLSDYNEVEKMVLNGIFNVENPEDIKINNNSSPSDNSNTNNNISNFNYNQTIDGPKAFHELDSSFPSENQDYRFPSENQDFITNNFVGENKNYDEIIQKIKEAHNK